jgi:hypothetical protein
VCQASLSVLVRRLIAIPFLSRSRKALHDWVAETVVVDRSA